MTMRDGPALHGWLVVDKPLGIGSTDVVSRVKRALREGGYAKVKVGHGGTLDPLASGVLPIALGEATKLAGRALDSDKTYDFTIRFGAETDTLDAEGAIIGQATLPSAHAVWSAMSTMTGSIAQVPPSFSAIKVDGARAYDLARSGVSVELMARQVQIYDLYSTNRLGNADDTTPISKAKLRAKVSKGTYIRSLARDIAHAADTLGYIIALRRIVAGPFNTIHAITLDKIAEAAMARTLEHHLLPLRAGLDDIPALSLTPDQAGALRQGRVLAGIAADDGPALAMLGDTPVALVEVLDREVRVERGFNL